MISQGYNDSNMPHQQRDLVLSINEFCFVQNKTNGTIKTCVGPLVMTISQTEALVTFDTKSKKFIETSDFEKAKQLFISAPEGWYCTLKNPVINDKGSPYPPARESSLSPESIVIGTKINIPGPISFALYPGQMAKVVRGHRLRSNQYLIARVYDAEAAKTNSAAATMIDAEGNVITNKENDYFMGQLLVIKGTEMSFYIPPTGIEVIPIDNKNNEYVRDAVTLERLEYAILKDEDGEKRYTHGPAVVFPKPTETFVETPKGGTIFRALELSPISGIYVKVIAAYDDENKKHHPIGEELFITGNEQMIYYPRPEHAMIQYDGKYMHHAIAIPKGEGRYILNRLTGEINTIIGPRMYLPDPRTEIVVKRKLTKNECALLYPNNNEVLEYNMGLDEKDIERKAIKGLTGDGLTNAINCAYSTADQSGTLAIFEANANISRGSSYTKPRTITLDTKFDGVVEVNVWTGYAVNVVSKNGKREVVTGPATRLLDYDETLEPITLSTGKPKNADKTITTAYLNISNNKVSDKVVVSTKDGAEAELHLYYTISFLPEYKDKWFNIENYVQYMANSMRSLLKREIQNYNIEEFYSNVNDIIRNITLDIKPTTNKDNKSQNVKTNKHEGRLFEQNGMLIQDVEVLNVLFNGEIADMINQHQTDIIEKTIELADVENQIKLVEAIAAADKKKAETQQATKLYKLELSNAIRLEELAKEELIKEKERVSEKAKADAQLAMQGILNEIEEHKLSRLKAQNEAQLAIQRADAEIEAQKEKAYADTVKEVITAIGPDLVAALTSKANADMLESATKHLSPYAIAQGGSVADSLNTLLRGTSLEKLIDKIGDN